jgi:tetratricopeptide (TPR) repeat protein
MRQVLCFLFLSLGSITFCQNDCAQEREEYLDKQKKSEAFKNYNQAKKVNSKDPNYIKSLETRNTYGWIFATPEDLSKDIKLLLETEPYQAESSYLTVVRPSSYPPCVWPYFYEKAEVLLTLFDSTSAAYREVLSFKIFLNVMMRNDALAAEQFPELIKLFTPDSDAHTSMIQWYGISLNRSGNYLKAIEIYQEAYKNSKATILFLNLLSIYYVHDMYAEIRMYEADISSDTVGASWFYLAYAQLKNEDTLNAKIHFDKLISKLTFTEYSTVELRSGMNVFPMDSKRIEIIADFYYALEMAIACKFYRAIPNLLINEKREIEYRKTKIKEEVITDETREILLKKIESEQEEERNRAKQLETKLNRCN